MLNEPTPVAKKFRHEIKKPGIARIKDASPGIKASIIHTIKTVNNNPTNGITIIFTKTEYIEIDPK